MPRAQTLGTAISAAAIFLLAVAGFMKLIALDDFAVSLESFTLLPGWTRQTAVIALPVLELLPMILWCFWPRWRAAAEYTAFTTAMLIASVVGWHLLNNIRPACNCYGKVLEWLSRGQQFRAGVWVSGGIAAALLIGSLLRSTPTTAKARVTRQTRGPHVRSAFTLIEVLVSLLIISILLAVSVPALLGARQSARVTATLNRLHSATGLITVYATEGRDALPYFVNPAVDEQTIRSSTRGIEVKVPQYFAAMTLWTLALADRFFDGIPADETMSDARSVSNDRRTFLYPCTFAAHPDYWARATRLGNRRQWGPVKLGDARTPARKAAFVSPFPFGYWPDGRKRESPASGPFMVPLALLDGHATEIQRTSIAPGMLTGDGTFSWCNWHPIDVNAALHTIEGIRGTDIP